MAEKEKRGMFSRLFGGSKANKEADVEENPTAVLEEQSPVSDESPPAVAGDVEDTIGDVAVIDPPEPIETPERETQSKNTEDTALSEQTEALDTALNQPNGDEPDEKPEKEEEKKEEKRSWFKRLKQGLSRSSSALGSGITGIFTKRKLDDETLEELEDVLIQADLGVETALAITEKLAETRYNKEISDVEVKTILAEEVKSVLEPVAQPLDLDSRHKPHVVLMIGVNGTGKTTTIGKLASKLQSEGKKVMMAAGDTFRAAAVEQLKIWGERTGSPVIAGQTGADAAGLAFDAMKTAQEQGTDVLLIDTAGRLQNKAELMDELKKVIRVIKKHDESAPHSVLLTLDATTGQNALSQVEIFGKTADVTGLVMTKLDGTARGGILVAIARKYQLPVHFIGVGEGIEDLEPFSASDFAKAIAGLD
ncbi:MAG: signal recognition particle-docking protein FtsY [Stappiaceae bacterium]